MQKNNNELRNNRKKQKFRLDDDVRQKIEQEYSQPTKRSGRPQTVNEPHPHHTEKRPPRKPRPEEMRREQQVSGGREQIPRQKKRKKPMPKRPPVQNKRPRPKRRDYDRYESYEDYGDIEELAPPKKKKHRLWRIAIISIIICVIVLAVNMAALLFTGKIWFNEPKKRDYPIRGPIVNSDIGSVNWDRFAKQNIQLAFISATKSTTYVDKNFEENWNASQAEEIPTGAIHRFDIAVDGAEQAEHFHKTVGSLKGHILPVVQVKLTGMEKVFMPDYDKITKRLVDYCERIGKLYKVRPIIFVDKNSYKKIICNEKIFTSKYKTNFERCPIWYESLYSKPKEDINWQFWGYTNKAGYSYCDNGKNMYVTLFNGDKKAFEAYIVKR